MKFNWTPTPAQGIAQNVSTLIAVGPYEVPLSRRLGVAQDLVDSPSSVVAARLQADIVRAVREYEPRASVRRVVFEGDASDGLLRPVVRIEP